MSSNFCTIDLETSIKNRGEDSIGKNKASPFYKDNKICYVGVKCGDQEAYTNRTDSTSNHFYMPQHLKLLVGANIKFDLLYLMGRYPNVKGWLHTNKIWDVQLAEYLLTGQEWLYPHLGDKKDKEGAVIKQGMATQYGGTDKDSRLAEMWGNNVDTEDIDEDLILPYLKDDVRNTELVFKGQVALAQERNMLPLMWSQMDALLATTEMEYNGMQFDKEGCVLDSLLIEKEVHRLSAEIGTVIAHKLGIDITAANCNSPQQISTMLFGGVVDVKKQEPVMKDGVVQRYKSGARVGQIKTVLKIKKEQVMGFGFTPRFDWATKKTGVYQVNDKVIKELMDGQGHVFGQTRKFLQDILKYRGLNKDLKTYYVGYSSLVWPDSKIHPQFNHCATATGRLSHSAPNLGNVSHAKDDD